MDRDDPAESLKETCSTLSKDIDVIQDLYVESPNSTLARSLARSYSAYIEGTLSQLRQEAISSATKNPHIYTPEELSVLLEKQSFLNKKGEIEHKDCFERFLPIMLFTMRQYIKVYDAKFSPDTSDNRWCDMREFVALRNRLMHPTSATDLQFSQEDLKSMLQAVHWFHDNHIKMIQACQEASKLKLSKKHNT